MEGEEKAVAARMAISAMLRFSAGLFRDPLTSEGFRYLASLDLEGEDALLDQEGCRKGLARMRAYCSCAGEEEALRRASGTFRRLFVGPHHVPCPPWGSVYLDGGRLFGPSSLEVARVFARCGFTIPEGGREPSDHVAYELAFLGEHLERAAQARRDGDREAAEVAEREARAFSARYLEPWFSEFAAKVRREDADGLYEGLADLTDGLLGFARILLASAPARDPRRGCAQ